MAMIAMTTSNSMSVKPGRRTETDGVSTVSVPDTFKTWRLQRTACPRLVHRNSHATIPFEALSEVMRDFMVTNRRRRRFVRRDGLEFRHSGVAARPGASSQRDSKETASA